MFPTKWWPLANKAAICSCVMETWFVLEALFLHGPNLAVEKHRIQKGPFQSSMTSSTVNRNCSVLKAPTNHWPNLWGKDMYVLILLSHCPKIWAFQNTWCDCFCGFKKLEDYFFIWKPHMVSFTGPHPYHPEPSITWHLSTEVQNNKKKKCSVGMTKADIFERKLGNDKLNPKGLSEISDTSNQTFPSLLRGTQKLMRKLRCVQ